MNFSIIHWATQNQTQFDNSVLFLYYVHEESVVGAKKILSVLYISQCRAGCCAITSTFACSLSSTERQSCCYYYDCYYYLMKKIFSCRLSLVQFHWSYMG